MQDILYWPINRMKILCTYLNNRWFIKSHGLTSRLKHGEWHDFDTRLLHAAFDEVSGWSEHYEEKRKTAKESDDDDFFDNLMEDKSEAYKDSVALCYKLEKEQEEEDTTMLIRLVKIRCHLWT